MELDCYNSELEIAVELNGSQHYEYPNRFHRTLEIFKKQLFRDREKERLCKERGVRLISLPYWVKWSATRDFLIQDGAGS